MIPSATRKKILLYEIYKDNTNIYIAFTQCTVQHAFHNKNIGKKAIKTNIKEVTTEIEKMVNKQ